MKTSPDKLVAEVAQLASFPEVAIRLNEATADEKSGAKEIGAIISVDPALTAALLRIANGPLYRVSNRVGSIERAVTIVGLEEIRDVAFGVCATGVFRGIPNELISVEDFWLHSLYCAVIAEGVAAHVKACRGQSLFTAGLLHDIGQLVMFNRCPELSRQALELSVEQGLDLTPHVAESEVFGFDHSVVGAELARNWQFPSELETAIRYHHAPFEGPEIHDSAVITHVANSVAVLAELDSAKPEDMPPIDERAFPHLGIDATIVDECVTKARSIVPDLFRIFVG